MKVTLVDGTENPIEAIVKCARICYGREDTENAIRLIKHLYKNGHHSVFEHVYFRWKVEGISRVTLAQLSRHRLMSLTVRSQRYCNEADSKWVIPEDICADDLAFKKWKEAEKVIREAYNTFIKRGIKKEDARFILPQATTTDLYITMNLRELIHLFNVRASIKAQWEIRRLVYKMVLSVTNKHIELSSLFKIQEEE